jgi:hypothetical protein
MWRIETGHRRLVVGRVRAEPYSSPRRAVCTWVCLRTAAVEARRFDGRRFKRSFYDMPTNTIRLVTATALVVGLATAAHAQSQQPPTTTTTTTTTPGDFTKPVVQNPAPSKTGGSLTTPGTTVAPTWELSGGYQTLHAPDNTYPFGLNLDGARNFGAMSIVAELGWLYDTEDTFDTTLNAINFGGGPRWTARSNARVWPFVQVLAGGVFQHASSDALNASDSATNFMLQPGGGAVFVVGDGLGIVGQVDYRRLFTDQDVNGDSGQNQFRVFVGLRMILD